MKTIKYPVRLDGRKFCGISEFDCKNICLFTEPTMRGTFFTSIPISELAYRREHHTRAKSFVLKTEKWTSFFIDDDWGTTTHICIHNSLKDKIDYAIKAGIEQELLSK